MATSSSSTSFSPSSNPPGTISQTPILLLKDLVSVKLDATNYVIWKYQILSIFESYSLLDMVDGTSSPPAQYLADANGESSLCVNPLYKQWKARDQALKTLINATLSPSAITLVIGQTTAQGVWQVLERRYTSLSRTHVLSLKAELDRVKKSSTETMTVYLDRVKEIRDKLGSVGVNVDDEDLLHVVLKGLTPEYDSFCSAMRTRDRVISCEELHVLLTSEEESKKNTKHTTSSDLPHMAMAATNSQFSAPNTNTPLPLFSTPWNRGRGGRSSNRGRGGRNSFGSNRGGYPSNPQGFSQSYNSPGTFNGSSQRPQCQICGKTDTGATDHFTPDISHIPDCYEYCGNEQVTVGNGQSLPIKHSDNNASFSFDAHKFQIKDLSSGKLLYNGLSEHGLYPIHGAILPKSSSPKFPKSFHTSATDASSKLWHSRLGHPQQIVLQHVLHKHLSLPVSPNNSVCSHCLAGKMHQLPFPKSVSITSRPLEIVHSDVWGPAPITSNNGTRYYVTFVDEFTRFTWFFPLQHKCQVLSSFMHFKSTMENLLSCKLKILRTDCGGEYSKHEFQSFCSSTGVLHQFTCPHTSQQNGVAERKHRHIVDKGLTLMSQASLPLTFWPYAFSTSVFLINRLPSPHRGFISPWERLFGSLPSYTSFRSFGCACYPLLRPYSKHKLLPRSVQCVFLGPAMFQIQLLIHLSPHIPVSIPSTVSAPLSMPTPVHSPLSSSTDPLAVNSHPMQTRAKSGISKKKQVLLTATAPDYLTTEPPSFAVARHIPQWHDAMASEFAALQRQSTWSLVPPSPDHHIIGCHWVFKLKRNSDGSVARYKARLVAQGNHQLPGIDFDETFSPVVKPATVRLMLSIAAQHQWSLRQLDVSNAFLHGSLKECVYMRQPPGFVDTASPSHVCFLHKSIYGLRQAPRAWFEKFSSHLLTIGFTASQADPSLFLYKHGSTVLFLLLYVDDIILTGNAPTAITDLIANLASAFELKDLGPLKFFLGLQIDYKPSGFFVHQTKYAVDVLSRHNMTTCKPCSSPFVSSSKLPSALVEVLPDPTPYCSLVGAFQYLTFTRPDLSFAVNSLCSLSHGLLFQPGPMHLTVFTDADWAGNPVDRRSTTGFLVFLGNNLITWASKKQPTVSRSSTEAEYRSLAVGAAEVAWIRMLLSDLHVFLSECPLIWCDNTSAISLASNPVFHARTKHVEVDYHFVQERVVRGDLKVQFIPTVDQLADLLTKALPTPRFVQLANKLLHSFSRHLFEGG
uniref:Integrase catalytic domain-containing protein n=1 Tax=Fagus sylvatica TaxID=28930 RepID=A0A2N9E5R8_FAGSY